MRTIPLASVQSENMRKSPQRQRAPFFVRQTNVTMTYCCSRSTVTGVAREISERHLAPLEHSKITVQMGRDLSLSQAIQIDQLVGSRLQRAMDPTANLGDYLTSQKGGPNPDYKRPDV